MANAREIQNRIKSIQDTMKITSAMYMISSTKLKKAKKSLDNTEPYFYTMQAMISRILRHIPDMNNDFFNQRSYIKDEDRKKGYIVITADKGLAGSYNHNLIKLAQQCLDENKNTQLFVVGILGEQYFERKGIKIDINFKYTAQDPTINRARNITERLIERYLNGELDEIHVIYTRVINAVSTEVQMQQLLPLKAADFDSNIKIGNVHMEEIAMIPSPDECMDSIARNYVSGFVYGALVESYASEQSTRVMAMEGATNSAKKMLHDLSIEYNRARQAAITQEITEVIGGAKAQKKKRRR